jgi:hypothetical protein
VSRAHPHRREVMAQKSEPLAHADELAELWNNLLCSQRRALLVLSYGNADLERELWQELPTDARMRLVRAMRALTDLAVDCAVALERAKAALERASQTPREKLQAKIDEAAFGSVAEAEAVRQELADMRARKRRS